MKASLITIGTEILIGQIIDTNSAYIGEQLGLVGFELVSRITVSDNKTAILNALKRSEEDADVVLITGGLGPTKDDITKGTLATYFGREQYFDENIYQEIVTYFESRGRTINQSHKDQSYFPSGVRFLENQLGTAPGMLFDHNETIFISMPGVPFEMKNIMEFQALPILKEMTVETILHKTILTIGRGESQIADMISDLEDQLHESLALAYLPSLGGVRLRLTAMGKDPLLLKEILVKTQNDIEERLGDIVFGYEKETLAGVLGEILVDRNLSMGTSESCTGGAIASLITATPGSSRYFKGSIIAYDYDVKTSLLDVKKDTLLEHGAVSSETVEEMLKGFLARTSADLGISVSGIAGPGGGTPDKPVGTVWIAVGNKDNQIIKKLQLSKMRDQNIKYTSYYALNMLRKFILKYYN